MPEVVTEASKYGIAGIAAGLIFVLVTVINNNFKERVSNTQERLEAAKTMAESIQGLRTATDKNNELIDKNIRVSEQIYEYLKIRNGIADKTSSALAHALDRLGIDHKLK